MKELNKPVNCLYLLSFLFLVCGLIFRPEFGLVAEEPMVSLVLLGALTLFIAGAFAYLLNKIEILEKRLGDVEQAQAIHTLNILNRNDRTR